MQRWSEEAKLYLLSQRQFEQVPDGTVLTCIDSEQVTKGQDTIDMDTRFGRIAYGFVDPFNTLDKDLLTMLLLVDER